MNGKRIAWVIFGLLVAMGACAYCLHGRISAPWKMAALESEVIPSGDFRGKPLDDASSAFSGSNAGGVKLGLITESVSVRTALPGAMQSDGTIQEMRNAILALRSGREGNLDHERTVVNEALARVRGNPEMRQSLEKDILLACKNPNQDPVVRDYYVQHLRDCYEESSQKAGLEQLFWALLSEKQGTIAGTALLALNDIARRYPTIDKPQLEAKALSVAGDSSYGDAARVSALRVCGFLHMKQVLPIVEGILEHSKSVALRVAAIATLGDFDSENGLGVLTRIAASADDPAQRAAQAALQRKIN